MKKTSLAICFVFSMVMTILAYPVLAASKPTYIIAFVPLNWSGSRSSFEQAANRHADLFIRESGIEQYAQVEIKLLEEGLEGVSLIDEDGDLIAQVVEFGLAREPADRYVGLTDGDLAPDGDSWVAGYTMFFSNGVLAEYDGPSITAHEFGHTFGLCDEYAYIYWEQQDNFLTGGCPNPWPSQCDVDDFCIGAPAENGNNSIMGPSGSWGSYSFNKPCYDHLQEVFAELFADPNQPPEDTPTPSPPTPTPTPGPSPTPSPTPIPDPKFLFANPALTLWSSYAEIEVIYDQIILQPDWSPDGEKIVYVSPINGKLELFLLPVGENQPQKLINSPGRQLYPRWMPDSRHVLYVSDEKGISQLYIIDIETGSTQILKGLPEPIAWPSIRKDGRRIAFSAAPKGNWDIFLVELDNEGMPVLQTLKPLIASDGADISPDWSPDGNRIVFASDEKGSLNLYLYEIETQTVSQLTDTAENEWAPRWTRDGKILYHLATEEGMNILMYNLLTGRSDLLMFTQQWAAWPAAEP